MSQENFFQGSFVSETFCQALERSAYELSDRQGLKYDLRCGCEHCVHQDRTLGPHTEFSVWTNGIKAILVGKHCLAPHGFKELGQEQLHVTLRLILQMLPPQFIRRREFASANSQPEAAVV